MPRAYILSIESSHVVATRHNYYITRIYAFLSLRSSEAGLKALCAATDSQISVYLNNQLKNKKQAHQQNAALALCSGLLGVISKTR